MNRRIDTGRRGKGFSIMETMIAMFVLGVGLLGVAGLQLSSLRSIQSAYMRTIATGQIFDMAERMRSNGQGLLDGDYDAVSGIPGASSDCTGAGIDCTPAQLAAHDAYTWNTANVALLPDGTGQVTVVDGVDPKRFIVVLSWNEYTADKDTPMQRTSFSMEVQP